MSEREFELYLSLLARFLKLNPQQRAEISDELRDHLEERLQELTAAGVSREEAIERALHEFGDATDLAAHFSAIAIKRRRRFLMRCTAASVIALAGLFLLGNAFWPDAPPQARPLRAVIAQEAAIAHESETEAAASEPTEPHAETEDLGLVEEPVEEKLARKIGPVEYEDVTLREVLEHLSNSADVDIVVAQPYLKAMGISLDQPVSLSVSRTELSIRTLLDMILDPLELTYRVREGVIYVSIGPMAAPDFVVRIYNVRDLVRSDPARLESNRMQELMDVVRTATAGGAWTSGGSVTSFDGMLVVRQTEEIHAEIDTLLRMLRDAIEEHRASAPPPDDALPTYEAFHDPAHAEPEATVPPRQPVPQYGEPTEPAEPGPATPND